MSTRSNIIKVSALSVAVLFVLCVLDLAYGGSQLGGRALFDVLTGSHEALYETIVWKIRLPRLLTAMLAGGSLALSGALMQTIFRNPLSDPHIMGVSSGASLGAAVTSCLAVGSGVSLLSGLTVLSGAFIGAAACSLLVMAVSSSTGSSHTLLLFGVLLGFMLSAATTLVAYFAPEQSLKVFYSWSAGSFSSSSFPQIVIILVMMTLGLLLAVINIKGLDIHLFGDDYMSLCGANPKKIRALALLGCCLPTAAVTAVCGPLGFVGIVSPHIARRLLGTSSHAKVLPVSMLIGGCFAVFSDLVSMLLGTPLPVGSVMAFFGSPVVLIILLSQKR